MLVNCAAYQDGRKLIDLAPDAIHYYLSQPECFVWVALRDPEPAEIDRMAIEFNLHELAVEDARHGHQRPKLEEYGQTLFCVVHMLEFDEAGELAQGEVAIFVGSNFILSVRNQAKVGFLNVRERCEDEPHLLKHGSGYVFYALLDSVVDRYFSVVHRLEGELEAIEDRLFTKAGSGAARENIEALYALKRRLVVVNHAVTPMQEAITHLHGGRVPTVCKNMQEYYRDVDDHLARIAKTVESLRDMMATAVQVNLAMISLDDTAVSKKLAAYAALFAVPTMIAGIYGMNFDHMPELKIPIAYPIVVLTMIGLDVLLWWRFRKVNWL